MDGKILLIDSCIFLELLLRQDRVDQCEVFLRLSRSSYRIAMTEFSLYAIGFILQQRGHLELWEPFIRECQIGSFLLVSTTFGDEQAIVGVMDRFGLDLDDAHQYEAARRLDAELVSFDRDFDRTDIKRKEPKDYL